MSSPVENKPGSVFKYNNMATFMLSAIVQKATGEKLAAYLKPRLFDPLGITNYSWDETPEGYTFGAIGLKLPPIDMAKFGQLLLQKGTWQGQQLVPSAWVEAATSFQIQGNAPENPTPEKNSTTGSKATVTSFGGAGRTLTGQMDWVVSSSLYCRKKMLLWF
ncbi:MAG: serine hydrolase [Saprospiraceae bacterium]|nr:serine hydrolase [Saprospiraceae bacterium]